MTKLYYVLADVVEVDINIIFEYSEAEFGILKAIEYHENLLKLFVQLTNFPLEGKSRNEIKQGLRSIVYISHIVFYRIIKDNIRIVRVLHQSQNVLDYF